MSWLFEPLAYPFMRQAALAILMISVTCAALGVYVVLRRMAFFGDAVAHTTLPGLVIAYLNQWNLLVGAVLAAVTTALGIGWLSRRQQLQEDTAIGVLFTGMFALGIVLISTVQSYRDFSHMLFGNILGVTHSDLWAIGVVAVVVLGTLALLHKELMLCSVDPNHARAIGLDPDRLRYLLLVLMALAVVTGIQAVGVVLTSALLVTPAATSGLVTKRLVPMMTIAAAIACASGICGLYASYYLSISSGGAIVLVCTIVFALVFTTIQIRSGRQRTREALSL
ncbi:MAG: metal ABC transporter permease [Thermoanaerobaculia bacterium]|nr:metal ABC transporter permease [Thermoanaerobaculia bacterium]